jgi:hypothetical protein
LLLNSKTRCSRSLDVSRSRCPMPEMRYQPDWRPIEAVIAPDECEHYMYMAHAGSIVQYKHRETRRYLNIDSETGRFYRYADGEYLEISRQEALDWVRGLSSLPQNGS